MKKIILFIAFVILQNISFSQNTNIVDKKTQKAFAKLDYLSIDMPITDIPNEKNMGFTGIHYNLMINDWAYAGLGLYGAVSGNRGGFFTLGVNAGIKKYFGEQFYLDTGFHFGGGGGAAAPDGGGAFLLSHFNLGYDFKHFSINSGWSYVNFFDGGLIKGNQFNVALEVPLDFDYTDYGFSETEYSISQLEKSNWNIFSKRASLMFHLNTLKIRGDTQGINNGKTIKLAGFEYSSYFTKNWFAFLKVDGAFDGIKAGFMDVFLGGGYLYPFNSNKTNIVAKFGVGAAGGGGIDTKGGFLLAPDLSIEQRIFKETYLALNTGFVVSPDSHFKTQSLGLGIKYYVDRNGIQSDEKQYTSAILKGFEVITKHDVYFNAQRDKNLPDQDLHQISVQINFDIKENFYIAGQTSFATFGDAGAYAEGIVGLGARFYPNPFKRGNTELFIQALAGAAGGGDIATGQGLILKPSAGFSYKLNEKLSIRAAGGYVKSLGAGLSSPLVNLGIKYHISFLKVNP